MGIARRALRNSYVLFFIFTAVLAMSATSCMITPQLPLPVVPVVSTTTTTAAPLGVGTGSNNPADFIDAYNRKDGAASLGQPINAVHSWHWGCAQDFSGGNYQDAIIMQPHCSGTAYAVVGASWRYLRDRFAGNTPLEVGYPSQDSHRWGKGWAQNFDGGARGWTIVVRGDDVGAVHEIHGGFLNSWYFNYHEVSGPLGFPTSDEYVWGAGTRIDFQHGSLIWDGPGGIRLLGSAPAPTTSRESKAADWAIAELHSPDPSWSDEFGRPWSGYCEGFVEVAFGTKGKIGSADAHYNWQAANGRIHTDANPPRGAVVFYSGHVGISLGDGTTISTQGYDGQRLNVWHHATTGFLSNAYRGWAYAPDSWPGR